MKRRMDRGTMDLCDLLFAALMATVLLAVMTFLLLQLAAHDRTQGNIKKARADLRRIADAACVYAPPAEPAKEVPDP